MEGLEISEISFKNVLIDNEKFRLDNEFFIKKFINSYKILKSISHIQLKDCIEVLTDYHANGSYEILKENVSMSDETDYAYMIRSTDLEKGDYTSDIKYVSERSYNFLHKTKLFGAELLINKIGSPGRTYLMPSLNKPMTLGMNLFMIRTNKSILTEFLYCYFNTDLGQNIIKRKINGTVPLTIDKEAIRSLYIPNMSLDFQVSIKNIIVKSDLVYNKSQEVYSYAENILLEELGLKDWQPSSESINSKSFKESFLAIGRLDAEYYQPKYEEIINHIKEKNNKQLKSIVTIEKSIEPGSVAYQEEGIPFIRVSNLSKFGLTQPDIHLSKEDYSEVIRPKKDTILLTKDGSVGIAYKVENDLDCITSGALLHLKIKDENVQPDYLTLVLNSLIVKMQAERDAGGSIIQHWKPSEIDNVLIPIINKDTQQKISLLVQDSFHLRQQAEHFLEVAKHAVERAIEEDEEKAIEYINLNKICR